jgi:type I restriction enzyme S subunit
MKYQTYPAYKDSGVEWLGEVPEHWDIIRLKNILECRITDGPHTTPIFEDEGIPFLSVDGIQDGELKFDGCRYISEASHFEYRKKALPKKDDLLMGKAASTGKIARVKVNFEFSIWSPLALIRLDCTVSNATFFEQSLKSPIAQAQIENLCTSNTQKNISMDDIPKLILTRPPLLEQQKIAQFLDHETAKIDTLIEKQQRLIELLKEKRQAVISHAVTKGLNPNAPMKDSGVEWLGDVPEHWEVVPLKYLCNFSGGGTPSKDNLDYWTDGDIPWVSPKDMKSFWLSDTQDKVTERAVKESSTNFVEIGTLLMVVRSGILQRTIPIAINTVRVTLNQDMKALRFNERMNVEYAANFIFGCQDSLLLEWSKEGATVESIEHEYLSNGLIPVPSIKEQTEIVEYLNKRMSVFQNLEKRALNGIELLQERRTALISAAVTGKIDVREWKVPPRANWLDGYDVTKDVDVLASLPVDEASEEWE